MEKDKVIKRFALTPEMTCPELDGYKLPERDQTRTPIAIDVEILFDYNSILMDGKAIPATHPDGTVKGVWVYE
jgi:hypothetical protein